MSTNTVLRNLVPDTEYKVTLVPMYGDIEGKRNSENGKTSKSWLNKLHNTGTKQWEKSDLMLNSLFGDLSEALGGVKNLQVTDPTTSSLKVRWEPAEGNVRQYRLFYVPASGGAEDMVRPPTIHALTSDAAQGISWPIRFESTTASILGIYIPKNLMTS